uniref:Uncharacterized protein n=1 Tax=Clytia hemisphaerica TaxID=252671 RepID=A0A7M5VCJ7_9CNID
MTSSNQEAIDSLTERVNRLYNQVFTIPQPADSIKKPCDIIDETRCIFEQVEKKNSVVKQLWKTLPQLEEFLSTEFMNKIGLLYLSVPQLEEFLSTEFMNKIGLLNFYLF